MALNEEAARNADESVETAKESPEYLKLLNKLKEDLQQ